MIGGTGDVPFYVKIWRILTHPLAQRRYSIYFRQGLKKTFVSRRELLRAKDDLLSEGGQSLSSLTEQD